MLIDRFFLFLSIARIKKNPLLKNNIFFAIVSLFALVSCQNRSETYNGKGFCDSCEFPVLKRIFEIDTIQIFYKDYSDLNNVKLSFLPIDNRYNRSISTDKYVKDTSITNYISSNYISNYNKYLDVDTLLMHNNFNAFKDVLMNSAQIDSFMNKNKTGKYIKLSKPIFSENMKYVLVEIDYDCYGTCGEGYTYFLKRINNDWVLCRKIFRWIS